MKLSTPRIGTLMLAVAATAAVAGAITVTAAFIRPADVPLTVAFNLIDQSGTPVSERDFAGRHLLVFFGFTNCPHICPTQMAKLSTAMAQLEQSGHAQHIRPVFISVDPERDAPEQVRRFLAEYDQRFVGLTGPRPAITEAAATFKAYLQAAPVSGTQDYEVLHATTIYVVDGKSRIIGTIPGAEDAQGIAAEVRNILG